jgi:Asp-tRNA(Asn)/Glu-tRNA(Gln) amidotransferase A subunit family amidase
VGLQLIGRQRDDVGVLRAAAFAEEVLGGPGRAPF